MALINNKNYLNNINKIPSHHLNFPLLFLFQIYFFINTHYLSFSVSPSVSPLAAATATASPNTPISIVGSGNIVKPEVSHLGVLVVR
jgi:hypothetical protein